MRWPLDAIWTIPKSNHKVDSWISVTSVVCISVNSQAFVYWTGRASNLLAACTLRTKSSPIIPYWAEYKTIFCGDHETCQQKLPWKGISTATWIYSDCLTCPGQKFRPSIRYCNERKFVIVNSSSTTRPTALHQTNYVHDFAEWLKHGFWWGQIACTGSMRGGCPVDGSYWRAGALWHAWEWWACPLPESRPGRLSCHRRMVDVAWFQRWVVSD